MTDRAEDSFNSNWRPTPEAERKTNESPIATEPETEHEQLIHAILLVDKNAENRIYRLKIFLFWLPFVWSLVSAILWWIVLSLR